MTLKRKRDDSTDFRNMFTDLVETVKILEESVKKLRPVRKKYARETATQYTNEMLSFIAQVHGKSNVKRFVPDSESQKFKDLIGLPKFESDFQNFQPLHLSQPVATSANICAIFNSVSVLGNEHVHFGDPESCMQKLLKFQRKNEDLMTKCDCHVVFCMENLQVIAQSFIGPHRLKRLACLFLQQVLMLHSFTWTNLDSFIIALDEHVTATPIKIQGFEKSLFLQEVRVLVEESERDGPRWTITASDIPDIIHIRRSFDKGVAMQMFPPIKPNNKLEYRILLSEWS